jgi:prepilin-type processing-associated H-X9-DG protein
MRLHTGVRLAAVALATTAALPAPQAGARQNPPAPDPEKVCRNNLKVLAVAMMMYVNDYDETFPPMRSAAQVRNRLRPYVKNEAAFYCPVTRQPYHPQKALSGKTLASIKDPKTTTMLTEAKAHPGGTAYTAHADGHVK